MWKAWPSSTFLPVEVAYCGEGPTDAAVARALIRAAGVTPGIDYVSMRGRKGKSWLDARMPGLIIAARYRPVLVLRDLDTDAECASDLAVRLMPKPVDALCLRIAVRTVESWLMADRVAFAAALGVAARAVAVHPDALIRPKQAVRDLMRMSRRAEVRSLVSEPVMQPQRLAAFLATFAEERWDVHRAASTGASPTLTRALLRLRERFAN